jgi:hypothetical protein
MGYVGLVIGVLLLLFSMQLFLNIQQLLKENNPRKNGFDFVSISKTITNENMGKDNLFSEKEISELKALPQIDAVSPLTSNHYRVRASAGNVFEFSTDLFFESLDENFMNQPADFVWKPGQEIVPIILSSDFLEMYNVFAPAQGLPQLSALTITSLNLFLECSGTRGFQNFRGNVVGLSDQINSILVPHSFMTWSNKQLAGDSTIAPTRVFLKLKDANNPQLINYLDSHGFYLNHDKIQFGRIKSILQNIVSALGGFGILVIVMALLLFSFYLQLMIAKSKENLKLLLTLGYSPRWLSNGFTKTWLPVYAFIILIALGITQLLQILFLQFPFVKQAALPWHLHWSVIVMALVLLLITLWVNSSLVKKEINRL